MIAVLGVTVITPNPGRSFPHWLACMLHVSPWPFSFSRTQTTSRGDRVSGCCAVQKEPSACTNAGSPPFRSLHCFCLCICLCRWLCRSAPLDLWRFSALSAQRKVKSGSSVEKGHRIGALQTLGRSQCYHNFLWHSAFSKSIISNNYDYCSENIQSATYQVAYYKQ